MPTWTVPGYADLADLGHTRSGRTALGQHSATGVRVAIRYLTDDLYRDAEYLTGYRERARVLAGLTSPNIADVYEYVESEDAVATVRAYVDGVSLAALQAGSTLPPEAALTVLSAGLRGLAAAHAHGAAHGSYTPTNVLVDRAGQAQVADFGTRLGTAGDDVAAALATFVTSVTGSSGPGAADRLPRRLRALPGASTADAAALLGEVDTAARAVAGGDWETRGRQRLAQSVDRLIRRDRTKR